MYAAWYQATTGNECSNAYHVLRPINVNKNLAEALRNSEHAGVNIRCGSSLLNTGLSEIGAVGTCAS